MNKVFLIGNIGSDVEHKDLNTTRVANFNIAVNERTKKNNEPIETTTWFRIATFGTLADLSKQLLKKGQKVLIEGKIEIREYTNADGFKTRVTNIICDDFTILSPKNPNT
jgi:single-strand DNA-binding protein